MKNWYFMFLKLLIKGLTHFLSHSKKNFDVYNIDETH